MYEAALLWVEPLSYLTGTLWPGPRRLTQGDEDNNQPYHVGDLVEVKW